MSTLKMQKNKTKLRMALAVLLKEMPFEHVSVTDLCKQSGVSRITFYAYYDDKFALADELFDEMLQSASAIFSNLQNQYNPDDDPKRSLKNLLDSVLAMQEQKRNFIAQLSLESNSYLAFSYYWYVLRKAEQYSRKYVEALSPVYPLKMTTNLLCTGVWEFIRTGLKEHRLPDEVHLQAEELLDTLLNSNIFSAVTDMSACPIKETVCTD